MATENSTLPVSEEHLNSSVVEDTQNNSVPADGGETNAAVADDTGVPTQSRVDFADEDAALAAENAGLDLGEASPEEEAAGGEAAGSDLAGKSKEELLAIFAKMLEERPVQSLRRDVEALKIAFYKLRRAESDAARRAFVEAGGAEGDFVSEPDPAELRFKDLFREYRRLRDEFVAGLEAAKEENLKIKLQIIEELKELASSDEMLNQTFNKFRELQHRWKETGVVPQQNVKDLWETYNLHVENFYNFIKINKELRDLDLKKNYEQKVALCEQAEALVLEPSVVEAFHKLQKLHDEWRETGPVANEYKEVLWERFKAASSRINKQHQEHFEALKGEQVRNLELKTELCAATEELAAQPLTTRKEWNRASDRLLEIHSNGGEKAQALAESIEEQDDDTSLIAFSMNLFDIVGINQDDRGENLIVLTPSDHMLVPDFPGLPEDGCTITFERDVALSREDAQFITWEHPLIRNGLDLILSGDTGSSTISLLKNKALPVGTLLLELIYVVEAQAPKQLQLNRFLPATPVRMLLDKNGNNLAAQVEFESFNRQLSAVNRHTGSKLVNAVQQDVHAILQQGEAQIAKAAQGLIDAARNEADEKLTAELSRLEALKAVNPNIRDDELAAIESNRQQVLESLNQASWRLDALRLIVVTHQ